LIYTRSLVFSPPRRLALRRLFPVDRLALLVFGGSPAGLVTRWKRVDFVFSFHFAPGFLPPIPSLPPFFLVHPFQSTLRISLDRPVTYTLFIRSLLSPVLAVLIGRKTPPELPCAAPMPALPLSFLSRVPSLFPRLREVSWTSALAPIVPLFPAAALQFARLQFLS